jgi:hypothetical protein
MTFNRPQPIIDRIACWKQAYDAVLAELRVAQPEAHGFDRINGPESERNLRDIAARTAATLAIGATTRERGE